MYRTLVLKLRAAWLVSVVIAAVLVANGGIMSGTALAAPSPRMLTKVTTAVSHHVHRTGRDRDGSAHNVVRVHNRMDNALVFSGKVQFNRLDGSSIRASNAVQLRSVCDDCQSIALAVQINVIRVTKNVKSVNLWLDNDVEMVANGCKHCVQVGVAAQFDIVSDSPHEMSRAQIDAVMDQVTQMNQSLDTTSDDPHLTLDSAVAAINAILDQSQALAQSLAGAPPVQPRIATSNAASPVAHLIVKLRRKQIP